MEAKEKIKSLSIKGMARIYLEWPLYAGILFVAVSLWTYTRHYKISVILIGASLVYLLIAVWFYFNLRNNLAKAIRQMTAEYGAQYSVLMDHMAFPYLTCWEDGTVFFTNREFAKVFEDKEAEGKNIVKSFPELNRGLFPKEAGATTEVAVKTETGEYKAIIRRTAVEDLQKSADFVPFPKVSGDLITIYFMDVTQLNTLLLENEAQRMVAGLLYLDNYEEVMEGVEQVRQSLLFALVDRKITQYFGRVNGIVRKMENDKYFVVVQKSGFKELEEDSFSLLEDVKTVSVGNGIPVTLSLGLGLSADSYTVCMSYARSAIELALARGGDQVVVKDCKGITYYGGKREQTSKNTRVKARVKAEALREIMLTKGKIFVMGHKLTDVDALGAAVGIYRAAVAMDRRAYIVLNEVSASLKPLYLAYKDNPDYPEDLFIGTEDALEMMADNSLVVVVDTNRPIMVESPEVLKAAKTVVAIDHHRQSSDYIKNTVLSYVEPYASSACEMVSEILQYVRDDVRIPKLDASSMYAGIMIDTNNFVYRTGVRTFEAAAFLRRHGADIALVKKMFRDDMASYKVKAAIVDSAEVYVGCFAIAKNLAKNIESPTIIGAQAANELLDIDGIKAAFVLTVYNGRIYVSARSIDEVNVQIIMEKLGGGGHINAAGAQFDHTDINDAVKTLKEVIRTMREKGDIK